MKIHNLTLVRKLPDRWRGNVVGLWLCDCGQEKPIPMVRVKNGHAKSCGCLREKHGHAKATIGKSPEYSAWGAMWARCRATKGRDFESYAARGIGVCERWNSFENFLADMGPKPSPKHSMGRKNNDLGYTPDNCRWETATEQQRNRRDSVTWHIKGSVFGSLRDAARHFGVDGKTIHYWTRVSCRESCYVIRRY